MTTTPVASSPLAALEPIVVLPTQEHGITILLGADAVSTQQRDAAIAYLNETIGSSGSFRLEASTPGQPYKLAGAVRKYTGDEEFREEILRAVEPAYRRCGTLTLEVIRNNRRMIGVECVVTSEERGTHTSTLPVLGSKPDEVLEIEYEGPKVAFTLKKPTRKFDKLLRDALRVAKKLGVYVERPPERLLDKDRRAGLYADFKYVEPPA